MRTRTRHSRLAVSLSLFACLVLLVGSMMSGRAWAGIVDLHDFNPGPSGVFPNAALVQAADGNFYGATEFGGDAADGLVFRVASDGTYTVVHNFIGTDGSVPDHLALGPDGDLYGVTISGGNPGNGTVYKMSLDGTITTLHNFNYSDGQAPSGKLAIAADGTVYGSTLYGGDNGMGTIFSVSPDGTFSTVRMLSADDGQVSFLTLNSAGELYGATAGLGWNHPGIFKLTSDGTFSVVYSFVNPYENGTAAVGLVFDSANNLWGVSSSGGDTNNGTIFEITADGTFSRILSFDGTNGSYPYGLQIGLDGKVYGATFRGGDFNDGVVFSVDGGTFNLLHSFTGADGLTPSEGPTLGTDGALYGVTYDGQASAGTVYRLSGTSLTTIHSFALADGAYPTSALSVGPDGNIYGTTYSGGLCNRGAIFCLTPSGVSLVHSFHLDEGYNPSGGLLSPGDGYMYGTTSLAGQGFYGGLYRLDVSGNESVLHKFVGNDAAYPAFELASDPNYDLVGAGTSGGDFFQGAVYESGVLGYPVVALHSFNGVDGSQPSGSPLRMSDGTLYGVTSSGGAYNAGTIYEIAHDGTSTSLYSF